MAGSGSSWRRGADRAIAGLAAVVLGVSLTVVGSVPSAAAFRLAPYKFKNVKIGGTGFVSGIVFSQARKDLAYARTDVGGAYRWDGGTESWTPLLDWVDWDHWGYMGVASIAASPSDANKVWAAVGMYTSDWNPDHGAILRSGDQGGTWKTTVLPFKLGGNMPGRGMGERLAVDPNNDNVLFLAAPSGKGLWRSTDGGATWAPLAGAPTGFLPHKGVLDPVGHRLYIATSDTSGPFDGGKGDVWKYDTVTGAWTRISPVPSTSSDDYFGYSGLTIDRQHPDTIMVGTQVSWWPDGIIWRSTDAGSTWTRIWDWGAWPNRNLRYTFDITATPWATMGAQSEPPILVPRIGQAISAMEIDPFASDRMLFNGGPGIAGTKSLTSWDTGGTVTLTPEVEGLEEGATLGLIKPPGGPLVSAMGDVGGFRHDDLDAAPKTIFTSPIFTTTRSVDYAERNPKVIVRAGDFNDSDRPGDSHAAFSTDGGATWFQGSEPGGVNSGGNIAAAADGSRFVWAPGDSGQQVVHSTGYGTTWAPSAGVPANAIVSSDRVNPMKFYALSNGTFYVSTDGGANFTATATGLPVTEWGPRGVKAVPGREGDLWVAGGTASGSSALWHSTDSGATFTRVSGVEQADNIGFGKAAPGRTYPALYAAAKIGGTRGVFRSDDAGQSWVRINDDLHQYGGAPEAITGDPDIYGRVYFSGYGRGVLYGDQR